MMAKDIEDLFKTKKYMTDDYTFNKSDLYQYNDFSWDDYYQAKNCNSIVPIANLLDSMMKETEVIPCQHDYVKEGIKVGRGWWETNKGGWNTGHELAMEYRLAQQYKSLVIEIHTKLKLQELFNNSIVITHQFLDFGLGVDIVFQTKGKQFYIHILKDSPDAKKYLKQKEKRNSLYIGKKWIKYQRTFKNHLYFMFDEKDGKKCKNIGGMAFFTDYFLLKSIMSAKKENKFEDMSKETKVDKFLKFLKDKGHVDKAFDFQ